MDEERNDRDLVFVSYSREDADWRRRFVEMLKPVVRERGYDAWSDERMRAGEKWHPQIEDAIDRARVALLLVSPSFLASDFIMHEELPALAARDVPLLCVLVRPCMWEEVDILRELRWVLGPKEGALSEAKDPTPAIAGACRQIAELLPARGGAPQTPPSAAGDGRDSPPALGDIHAVPELPLGFVEPAQLDAVRSALLSGEAALGLAGPGGVGKTVLAAALARDATVRRRFADGVFWVRLGDQPDVAGAQMELLGRLGQRVGHAGAELGEMLRNLLADRRCLLVVDDVSSADAAEAFAATGSSGRVVYTSRDAKLLEAIGAVVHLIEPLPPHLARELLATIAGVAADDLPPEADRVLKAMRGVPLAVALVGAAIRHGGSSWEDAADGLERRGETFLADPYADAFKATQTAFDALDLELAAAYGRLARYPAESAIPVTAIARDWSELSQTTVTVEEARTQLEPLAARALLTLHDDAVVLHELQHAFLLLRTSDAPTPEPADDDRVDWISDARATVDLLQRAPLARSLATRLRRLREHEPGRSFLVHIDGRWGSGKSTLLALLRDELERDWLVVDFDAWRQMRVGPPWWALLASLRHAVKRDLGPVAAARLRAAESWQRARRGGALYVTVVTILLLVVVGIAVVLGAGVNVSSASDLAKSLVAVAAGIGALYAATSAVGRFMLWDSAAGARVFEQSHRDPMESVADHFAWLIARAGRPVVFFVDDLDRCGDGYVVDLLDSVQTLIRDAPARIDDEHQADRVCYVVVAADGRWIRRSYEQAHTTFAGAVEEPGRPLGYLFLDKIFQLTVQVPSMSSQRQAQYMQALLRVHRDDDEAADLATKVRVAAARVAGSTTEAGALQAFDEAPVEVRAALAGSVVSKLAEPQIEQATRHRLERFAGLLEANPRAMKLVLNAYGMARALQVMEDNVVPSDALALWTILRVRWPALADYVREHPEALQGFVDGHAPNGVSAELAVLFGAPDVMRILRCPDGGPLSPATIMACCGLPVEADAEASEKQPAA